MIKHSKKHRLWILLGIFVFPILFQSLHVLEHHLDDLNECHHDCSTQISHNNNQQHKAKITQDETVCPILSYELSVNDLHQLFIFQTNIPAFAFPFKQMVVNQHSKSVFSVKSPRAPPLA